MTHEHHCLALFGYRAKFGSSWSKGYSVENIKP